MKKTILIYLLLIISAITSSQQISSAATVPKHNILKKIKIKTRLHVLLIEVNPDYRGSTDRPFLVIDGLFAAGASIPNFIASGRNRNNAGGLCNGKSFHAWHYLIYSSGKN